MENPQHYNLNRHRAVPLLVCTLYEKTRGGINMKALIIDDEPLARNELTYLLNEIGGFEEINEAENVKRNIGSTTDKSI